LICVAVLLAGALCERPWGGFWWTFRLDGLAMGVLLSLGMAGPWRLPRIGIAMAMFWLGVASILARILEAVASGFAPTSAATIFGFVVASTIQTQPQTQEPSALQRLGELSFSIYLVHLPIMVGVREGLVGVAPAIVVLLLAIGMVLCSALMLDRSVTRPARILGRRFSKWMFWDIDGEVRPTRAA
jgi:peptidoglycan/LPS O-acetylase OafA/YrhL